MIKLLKTIRNGRQSSCFDDRTEEASSVQYFQFYGYLSQQQNMNKSKINTRKKAVQIGQPVNFSTC